MATYFGYDPGGNGKHGIAAVEVASQPVSAKVHTASDAHQVVRWIRDHCAGSAGGIGIDTLLTWELGKSGWRGADVALRKQYPEVQKSVASSNSLYGSMSVQGPAVALKLRESWPKLGVTETHPKVLYFALTGTKYEWSVRSEEMTAWLLREFGLPATPVSNDHEWDALLSACAAWRGFTGQWATDLAELGRDPVSPVPRARYFWPEPVPA